MEGYEVDVWDFRKASGRSPQTDGQTSAAVTSLHQRCTVADRRAVLLSNALRAADRGGRLQQLQGERWMRDAEMMSLCAAASAQTPDSAVKRSYTVNVDINC